jgi:hypothetical protein
MARWLLDPAPFIENKAAVALATLGHGVVLREHGQYATKFMGATMVVRASRYFLMLSLVALIVGGTRAEAQTVADQWLSVKTGPAAVLLDPSPSSVVITTVARGTRVQAQRLQDGWYLVRVPKPENERAPVSGWVSAEMLSPIAAEMQVRSGSATVEPAPARVDTSAGTSSARANEVPSLLTDLRTQRDKVDGAIRALDGVADSQALRVRREKLDRAIQATEALAGSDAVVPPPAVVTANGGGQNPSMAADRR